MTLNNYKGYSLFKDIKDRRLRMANQGVVLANIFEDHLVGSTISGVGAKLVLGYFLSVNKEDKKGVKDNFERIMLERGFMEAANV